MTSLALPAAILLGVALGASLRTLSRTSYLVVVVLVVAAGVGWWLYGRTLDADSVASASWGRTTTAFLTATVAGLIMTVWRDHQSGISNRAALRGQTIREETQ